ncbi:MAG: nitroreductase family protein, partial [Actinomycetota bacterium]|nr:nitroreductase family protein [Actinomycetota bacterium]
MIELLRTTGAARRFTADRVEPAVVHQLLDDARFAPSGGNRQPWKVAVVEGRTMRRDLGDLMQPVWNE